MASKIINISLDEDLLKEIDRAARSAYSSRSQYIKNSVMKSLELRSQLNYLHKKTAAAAKRAGINTEADVARVIKEVREGR